MAGLAIVTQLAARDDVIVFAGARDPSAAKDLHALEIKYPGKFYTMKLVSADRADADAAVAKIKEVAGALNVVIANAGMSTSYEPTATVSLEVVQEHIDVNLIGPLVLFQASYPLLNTSTGDRKFILISTNVGSVELGPRLPLPNLPYGCSKAAANWLSAKIFFEYPELVALPVHPGFVKTDMMDIGLKMLPQLAGAIESGALALITTEESAKGVLEVVDSAKRDEEAGPKLTCWDGSILPW